MFNCLKHQLIIISLQLPSSLSSRLLKGRVALLRLTLWTLTARSSWWTLTLRSSRATQPPPGSRGR